MAAVNPAYTGEPVTGQPGQHGQGQVHAKDIRKPKNGQYKMMQRPQAVAGCPPGLEYLSQLDQLIIKQQVELTELLTGFETQNRYRVLNNQGQQAYFAQEESDCLERQCCGSERGFKMHITDCTNKEVLTVERPFKFWAGCCWCADTDCCSMEVLVKDAQGQVLGYVKQRTSKWKPHYMLYDADMNELGRIRGPCCVCSCPCCGDVPFPITDPNETTQIGAVSKQWSGLLEEWITDADTYSVTFPRDMDVRLKAVFLGAAFLIDFMFFEDDPGDEN